MLVNRCDTHVHTLFSRHAYSTLEEDVRAAAEAGLELLGVADHFSPMIAPGLDYRDFQHFGNESVWPRHWHGITLLRSAEVDIMDASGKLFGTDVPVTAGLGGQAMDALLFDMCTRDLDYLVGSVHNTEMHAVPRAKGTAMYLTVLEQPKVLTLGHIGRAGVPFEVKPMVRAAKELHKLIEVNEHSLELADNPFFRKAGDIGSTCRAIALECAEQGAPIALNTDAHICTSIGQWPHTLAMLEEIHFPQELIATRSADAFLDAVAAGVGPVQGL